MCMDGHSTHRRIRRRKRLRRRHARLLQSLPGQVNKCDSRRRYADLANIVRLVALHSLDVDVAHDASVGGEGTAIGL